MGLFGRPGSSRPTPDPQFRLCSFAVPTTSYGDGRAMRMWWMLCACCWAACALTGSPPAYLMEYSGQGPCCSFDKRPPPAGWPQAESVSDRQQRPSAASPPGNEQLVDDDGWMFPSLEWLPRLSAFPLQQKGKEKKGRTQPGCRGRPVGARDQQSGTNKPWFLTTQKAPKNRSQQRKRPRRGQSRVWWPLKSTARPSLRTASGFFFFLPRPRELGSRDKLEHNGFMPDLTVGCPSRHLNNYIHPITRHAKLPGHPTGTHRQTQRLLLQ